MTLYAHWSVFLFMLNMPEGNGRHIRMEFTEISHDLHVEVNSFSHIIFYWCRNTGVLNMHLVYSVGFGV
jgi:hypothetical protein